MRLKPIVSGVLSFALILGGCATSRNSRLNANPVETVSVASVPYDAPVLKVELAKKLPTPLERKVREWIAFYTAKSHSRFQVGLNRGSSYQDLVYPIFHEYEIPVELYYIGLIESGFVANARSRSGAVGIWQLVRSTARHYGLRANKSLDERKDPRRSTQAAARYLRDLYRQFQDWYLAIAAYNAGAGRIGKIIRKEGVRDFWQLVKAGVLPRETMDYLPKVLAAAEIGRDPEKYGFAKSPNSGARLESMLMPINKNLNLDSGS